MKIAICGSGPSIIDKVEYIESNFENIICVSNTYKIFNKMIALVSSDAKWWDEYKPQIDVEKFCLTNPKDYELRRLKQFDDERKNINSGVFAMIVARKIFDATEVHMFGFDMTNKNGSHFFGPHENIDNTPEFRYNIFMNQFRQEFFVYNLNGIKINVNKPSRLLELI